MLDEQEEYEETDALKRTDMLKRNDLPASVEEDADWDIWEKFFDEAPKEKIVDFLMGRMAADPHFMNMARAFFESSHEENADDLIKAYATELDLELKEEIPDVEYIVSFTNRFLDMAEELSDEVKQAFYSYVIERMDAAIAIGVGWPDDDFLLTEVRDDLRKRQRRRGI